MKANFLETLSQILPSFPEKSAIAVSGGADSMALLHLLTNNLSTQKFLVISVDHGLRENSSSDSQFVLEYCQKHNIECIVEKVKIEAEGSIEEAAREARFAVFFEICKQKNIKHLFLAHHLNDQVENFFIRLERGSGIDGLIGMKPVSLHQESEVYLVRPLLHISKKDLYAYLKENNLEWREDHTNNQEICKRNKIRKILSSLGEEEELIEQRISTLTNHLARASDFIHVNIEEKFSELVKEYFYGGFCVDKDQCKLLHPELIFGIITKIMQTLSPEGKHLPKPRFNKFEEIVNKLKYSEEDIIDTLGYIQIVRRGTLDKIHFFLQPRYIDIPKKFMLMNDQILKQLKENNYYNHPKIEQTLSHLNKIHRNLIYSLPVSTIPNDSSFLHIPHLYLTLGTDEQISLLDKKEFFLLGS